MKRWIILLLVCSFVLSCIPAHTATAAGAKETTPRDIAIVFDNSGSMYSNYPEAWCRATYSMEVFASMMNEGDKLSIYPMWEVYIDGEDPNTVYSSGIDDMRVNPLVISNVKDAQRIRHIITPVCKTTPIESITAAYNGLKSGNSNAEKWLIVLTDGGTFYKDQAYNGDELSDTRGELAKKLGNYINDVNIAYLAIDKDAAMPSGFSVPSGRRYLEAQAENSAEVLAKLSSMCNDIFGRDKLPNVSASSKKLSFDVSMKKLIVFVQGDGISNVSLANCGKQLNQLSMHYPETGTTDSRYTGTAEVDTSLQGMLVTYEDCEAGDYDLSFSGNASSIAVYYEPDVDLVARLIDPNGNVVDPDEATAGTYTLEYGLMDGKNGQPVTSDLLGKTHYEITYSINDEEQTVTCDDKIGETQITLEAGDKLDARITATYLSGYTITKYGPDFGWPMGGVTIQAVSVNPNLFELRLEGGMSEYQLSRLEEDGVYRLYASYDGEKLTGEKLNRTTANVELDGGNATCTVEKDPSGECFLIRLSYNNGDPKATDDGDYEMEYSVTYTNEDGESGSSRSQETVFTVVNDGFGLVVTLDMEQDYYYLKDKENFKPIVIRVAKGHGGDTEPLTDSELASVQLAMKLGDETFTPKKLEILNDQSAFALHVGKEDIPTGSYDLLVHAQTHDSLGEEIYGEAEGSFEVTNVARWLKFLFIALGILAVLALIYAICRIKAYPKNIRLKDEASYSLNGRTYEVDCEVKFPAGKNRTLSIEAPTWPNYNEVACECRIELAKVTPWVTPSRRRSVKVVAVTGDERMSEIRINGISYKDIEGNGTFVKEGSAEQTFRNGASIELCGSARKIGAPRRCDANLSLTVNFS